MRQERFFVKATPSLYLVIDTKRRVGGRVGEVDWSYDYLGALELCKRYNAAVEVGKREH